MTAEPAAGPSGDESPARWRAAVHLAGHLVAADVCGVALLEVALAEDGACGFELPSGGARPRGPARTETEASVIVLMAGVEAERAGGEIEAVEDARCLDGLAGWVTDGDPREAEPYLDWLRLKAQRMIEDPLRARWTAALAGALLLEGRLAPQQAALLMHQEAGRYMRGA